MIIDEHITANFDLALGRLARTAYGLGRERPWAAVACYVDIGQAERAWHAQRDGWRLSYLDAFYATEHEASLVCRHYFVAWSDTVAQLKREKRDGKALTVLLEIIAASEAEQAASKRNAHREHSTRAWASRRFGVAARLDGARRDCLPQAR